MAVFDPFKIIFTLLVTGLACLAAGAIIGYRAGITALTRSVEEQLTAQREIKRRRIESYVENELRFTVAIGGLPETTEAAKALITAYREMRAQTQADPAARQADTVGSRLVKLPAKLVAIGPGLVEKATATNGR